MTHGHWSKNRIPEDAIKVTTYDEMQRLALRWANGDDQSNMIVIGTPGIGKTETMLAAMKGVDYLYMKGDATKYGAYIRLYEHVNQPVVLDDLDELIADEAVTGLLKSLLETKKTKIIQRTNVATLRNETNKDGVPPSFETTSRAMLLVNDLKSVSANFQACLDRSTIIHFCPDWREIRTYVVEWFDDPEVFAYVTEMLQYAIAPSCRFYYKAKTWKSGGHDWRSMIDRSIDPRIAVIRYIRQKKRSETEKKKIWKERTGQTINVYYSLVRKINQSQGIEKGKEISKGMTRHHNKH